jgi:DNA ligase-1
MKRFVQLYTELEQTTKTTEKVAAMAAYFAKATPADAAWAVYFLSGRKTKQAVPTKRLRLWAREVGGVSEWLFDECYEAVGDLAETIALLLPAGVAANDEPLSTWVESRLLKLRDMAEEEQKAAVLTAWSQLGPAGRLVWNKLITGSFRVGVSQLLVIRAIAQASKVPADTLAHRLMGGWQPTAAFYEGLVAAEGPDAAASRPYPFFLAHPLQSEPASLGEVRDWQAEWKWDGIRAQVIRRGGASFVWSRGEELVTDRYPELKEVADALPDGTAIDGEILPWKDGQVRPFTELQRRIGRKTVGKKLLQDVPVILMAYDLLEDGGDDLRGVVLSERRTRLERLHGALQHPQLQVSQLVTAESWADLAVRRSTSRSLQVEGLMLKRRSSPYRVGRVTGDWWKWKIEPFTVDAVLIYAQAGHGKRSGLFTDYTFGLWDGGQLVSFAKAYSGLTDAEIKKVDAFIRSHTLERFGPVRTVKPELVFELGFEAIQPSNRHKSGLAVRFPRMLRWRTDKTAHEADTLERVRAMIAGPA